MKHKVICMLTVVAVALAALVLGPSASAVQSEHGTAVAALPGTNTPHVLEGEVFAIAEVGDVVVVGGRFSQARNFAEGSPVVNRSNLLAYNRQTGQLLETFAPVVNDVVRAVVAGPDGTVFIGGQFGKIDEKSAFKIARLDARTAAPVAGFAPPLIDAAVLDLSLSGGRLFVAGKFTKIGTGANAVSRAHLAELNPANGKLLPGIQSVFAGAVWAGSPFVQKVDVSPDGSNMVVIGNFRTVDGQPRVQVARLDLTVQPAAVTSWSTSMFNIKCGSSTSTQFDVRDVDYSPDGSYFVVAATGGHTANGALCDGASRWESAATGAGQAPTWFAQTGGDSVYSVAVTGSAVYIGGHFRWLNNPVFVQSYKGAGAVDREGIAALDPVNGIPLSWNPGRDRGMAVWDLVGSPTGLYVGSDTDRIARYLYRGKLSFFPTDSKAVVPQPRAPGLPISINFATASGLQSRQFDGTTVGSAAPVGWEGPSLSTIRGAFLADDEMYFATSAGKLVKQSYINGAPKGEQREVELNGLTAFGTDLKNMTGMTYDRGRIFYTVSGSNALYMRFYSVESDIVGATRTTVVNSISGMDWRNVRGLFLAGGKLYFIDTAGALNRLDWANDAPVAGTRSIVSSPAVGGVNWTSTTSFALPGSGAVTAPSNIQPVATAANTAQLNALKRAVAVPADVLPGDTMLMFWSSNSGTAQPADPNGWQRISEVSTAGAKTVAWSRIATAGDAGASVTVSTAAALKADLVLTSYRGADGAQLTAASAAETVSRKEHKTPQAPVAAEGSWVVSYWSDKSADTSDWTPPAGQRALHESAGSGAGHVSELLTDSGGSVGVGLTGGFTAVANSPQSNAGMITIVLPSAG